MPLTKITPAWILALILFSALAVLVLGIQFSEETKVVTVEQDRMPLSEFTTLFLKEVESLESLYENQLLNVRDRIGGNSSRIAVSSICRDVIGIEQATLFRGKHSPEHIDLRESDSETPLPLPRQLGISEAGTGMLIDLNEFENEEWNTPFRWLNQPGHPPHFLCRLDFETLLLLRIDPNKAAEAADAWLAEWLPGNFTMVEDAHITAELRSPSGKLIAQSGEPTEGNYADFILPVSSLFGTWSVSSRPRTETVTHYRRPVLVGAGVLSIILAGAGLFGFVQQKRAIHLAGQRVSFVNRVSHELRTPMMNILLNVDLLSDPDYGDEARRKKRLGLIGEEAGRLSRLLENVLSFSGKNRETDPKERFQSLRSENCLLDPLLDSVISQFSSHLMRRDLKVVRKDSGTGLSILGDSDAVSQIIGNLISNGGKYAASGGKIEICTDLSEEGQSVHISVIDFGPGISKSDASRIFKPFVRLNETTSEGVSGTGLGLAIARDLAEAMGGTLELNSAGRSGACFVLTLPRAADNIVQMAG